MCIVPLKICVLDHTLIVPVGVCLTEIRLPQSGPWGESSYHEVSVCEASAAYPRGFRAVIEYCVYKIKNKNHNIMIDGISALGKNTYQIKCNTYWITIRSLSKKIINNKNILKI